MYVKYTRKICQSRRSGDRTQRIGLDGRAKPLRSLFEQQIEIRCDDGLDSAAVGEAH